MVLSQGDKVGRYRVEAELGRGGMGVVYRARDQELGRAVALKVLLGEADEATRARFRREARAACAFSHANAATVFDVGEHEDKPFIVMELVRGTTMRGRVGDTSVPFDERVRWLRDVARVLAAAHEADLVHRDVKPDNVMIADDGTVKLLDFGIARATSVSVDQSAPTGEASLRTVTRDGATVGSPAYMAPEQVRGESVDGRADQFAWGVMAFELLSGSLPWKESNSAYVLASSVLHDEAPPLTQRCSEVPAWLASAVARALSKNRDARFASMRELLSAIDAPVTGDLAFAKTAEASVARTTGTSPRQSAPPAGASKPTRAPRWVLWAAAAMAALAALLFFELNRQPDPPKAATVSTAPILGLNDEATLRAEQEILEEGKSRPRGSGSATASAVAASAEPATAAPSVRKHCQDPKAHTPHCASDNVAWCDESERRIACCVKGLAATPEGRCECPKGGTKVVALQKSGCAAPTYENGPMLQKAIRAHFDELKKCYEKALEQNAKLSGRLSVAFQLTPDGVLVDPELIGVSVPDAQFQGCVLGVFAKIEFSPPATGHVDVSYPLLFGPGGE